MTSLRLLFEFQVRNLKWLGFRVPLAIVNKAHQANQLYPFAISLIESVRTYERTCEKVRHDTFNSSTPRSEYQFSTLSAILSF